MPRMAGGAGAAFPGPMARTNIPQGASAKTLHRQLGSGLESRGEVRAGERAGSGQRRGATEGHGTGWSVV